MVEKTTSSWSPTPTLPALNLSGIFLVDSEETDEAASNISPSALPIDKLKEWLARDYMSEDEEKEMVAAQQKKIDDSRFNLKKLRSKNPTEKRQIRQRCQKLNFLVIYRMLIQT